MSQKQNSNFPDAPGKVTDDDKCGLYESSRTDSGFISSGNLLLSSEIVLEDIPASQNPTNKLLDSGIIDDSKEKDSGYMRLDSGVCLTESFSNLNIKQGFNDLNCPTIKPTPVESYLKSDLQKPAPVINVTEDIPWKIYYEQDDDGDTQLHNAITGGFEEVALALIRAAPHPRLLDTPNDNAQTPLHLAVETGQSRIARWLVVAGARPCPRGHNGDSPLHIAANYGDVKSIKAIADPVQQQERDALALSYQGHMYQPCNLDQWNYYGQTCVHVAALQGHVEVLRHLVWYGADINAREGCMGYTALHYAVERRDEAMVQFLLQLDKINVEAETYGGRNALEINRILPSSISQALRNRGVPTPYSSDEEDEVDSEDSGDELTSSNSHMFSIPMVNASA